LILCCLFFSALFSGSEIAFVSANKLRIELKKKRGTYRSLILANFYEKPAAFLSSMLVGNNIALVAFTTLATIPLNGALADHIDNELLLLLVNTLLLTLVVLIFGEFIPKTLFRLYADQILYFLAIPLRWIQVLLFAPSWVMTKASRGLILLFFREPDRQIEQAFTRLDLENFINETSGDDEEVIDRELFGKALNLYDVRARDCMVPRTEIENIDLSASLAELAELFQRTRLSRLIVTEGDIDAVCGYIHHQQLLDDPVDIAQLVRPMNFVPEVTRVTDLLDRFIKERLSIVCVVDEFGGVAGIVTLEDMLEQIFGEIEDEYDDDEHIELQIDDHTYVFSGRLEIDYLNDKFGLNLPVGDYQTLSGYLVSSAENIPEQGESVDLEPYRFVMETVSNTRIETVRVQRLDTQAASD
jgi:CBS domain containing-hemolysin-like protein